MGRFLRKFIKNAVFVIYLFLLVGFIKVLINHDPKPPSQVKKVVVLDNSKYISLNKTVDDSNDAGNGIRK